MADWYFLHYMIYTKTEYFILSLNPTLLKGDLQSQKKSHIEMEEAKDCWLVIYPCKRTSGGRGSRSTLLSQYSEDKFLCNVLPSEQENGNYRISEWSPEPLFDEESLQHSRSYFPLSKCFQQFFVLAFSEAETIWCLFKGFFKAK